MMRLRTEDLVARATRSLSPLLPALTARVAEDLFFTPPRRVAGAREKEVLAAARAGWVESGGQRIRTYTWGRGPRVALVHGWGGSASQLAAAFVAPLLARGRSVVAFDGPGHGASSGRWSSIPEVARALRAVAEAHGELEGAVGHSLGAAAIAFALAEGLRVPRVALIGPAADPTRWIAAFERRLGLTPEVMRRLRDRSERRLAFRWADLPMARLLAGIPVAALVAHDRDDREVPWEEGAQVADAVGATLLTTRGLGHRRILLAPDVAGALTDFVCGADAEAADLPCRHPACEGTAAAYGFCESCALEAELFDRGRRWLTASP